MSREYRSWGRYPEPPAGQRAVRPLWTDEVLPEGKLLAFGNGRSQGDVCLTSGTLVDMRGLNRILAFDAGKGTITAEAGITLDEILQVTLPKGWMLPVVPGTRFVTLGGAIANDVHGKNHHAEKFGGSFGHHVTGLTLRRTDGTVKVCKAGDKWFMATVGGLGLTGIICSATIQLMPVLGGRLERKIINLRGIGEFFEHAEANTGWDYSVAWVDATAPAARLGRGYLELARWSDDGDDLVGPPPVRLAIPFRLPVSAINPLTVKIFNEMWLRRPRAAHTTVPYPSFFWPLDGIARWQNAYGPTRFVQCQFVVPMKEAVQVLPQVLTMAKAEGKPSFLNTLKVMGDRKAAGMLSFPRAGVALALDFPFHGEATLKMLRRIEDVVMTAGGALYPAKDAAMSGRAFRTAYPRWKEFLAYRDPNMSSALWERVMGEE